MVKITYENCTKEQWGEMTVSAIREIISSHRYQNIDYKDRATYRLIGVETILYSRGKATDRIRTLVKTKEY